MQKAILRPYVATQYQAVGIGFAFHQWRSWRWYLWVAVKGIRSCWHLQHSSLYRLCHSGFAYHILLCRGKQPVSAHGWPLFVYPACLWQIFWHANRVAVVSYTHDYLCCSGKSFCYVLWFFLTMVCFLFWPNGHHCTGYASARYSQLAGYTAVYKAQ